MSNSVRNSPWLLAAAAILGNAPAGAQPVNPVIAAEPAMGDPMPDRVVRFPNGVTALADVTFQTIPGFRPLVLDLYRPAAEGPSQPLILYIHGGGWMGGHTRQSGAFADFPAVLSELAARGYVVASLEYRLSSEAPFPAAIEDVKAAIRFLRANAARYGIDPGKVAAWGGSAGGHLTALAALSCGATGLEPKGASKSAESDCLQGGVGWYGVYDFGTLPSMRRPGAAPPDRLFLDCPAGNCPAARVRAASPVSYVDPKDPPMLLIHGTDDQTVPVTQSRQLAARLRAAKVPVELIEIPKVGHSWLGSTPAATEAASLQALNATFAFFDKLFGVTR